MVEIIIASIVFLLVGAGIGYVVRQRMLIAEEKEKQEKGNNIIEKAKKEAQEIKYNARKEAKLIIKEERTELEKEIRSMQQNLKNQERELSKKEVLLEQKSEDKDKEIERIRSKEGEIDLERKRLNEEVAKFKGKQTELLEQLTKISGMTREEAKNEIKEALIQEARVDSAKQIRKVEEEAREDAEKKAKRIIGIAIQRFAGEYVSEGTISTVELPSEDIKGRLIGREGRNIRAFEQICGVDLIIDDTPEVVVISSFNVVRREIARLTIMKLISDGRIHPAKIEEFYEKSKSEFDNRLRELGEKAQMEIGVHGIHPEILKLVGALNWRTSYTQNQYQHALECAFLCGSMAAELGLNVKQARRAALLHDIGKVIDASAESSHAVVGAEFAKRYGESADIVHAIRAHHEDEKPESILAHIVGAADALSGARPGARKAMMESYVSRLSDIEGIVNSFDGVSKSYAISAGREVRVLVESEKVSDEETMVMSREIAKKIEKEMTYPGSIKVTVIRETRAVHVAK
ncbi:MAG: ribonuclease Y [Oligoflexia bacterium]|nr:ribonuclease Y [Oligoflexia bacterium]MBF0364744.1 ribonuclease Y [Oligoflexia bacterium]